MAPSIVEKPYYNRTDTAPRTEAETIRDYTSPHRRASAIRWFHDPFIQSAQSGSSNGNTLLTIMKHDTFEFPTNF